MRYLAVLLLLVGCGTPGLMWEQANIQGVVIGALNVGNARPPVEARCGTARFMSPVNAPVCAYAFVDSQSRRVDIFDLLAQIDSFAETLTQLQPWVNKINDRKDERLFPYKMYLLTVSPAIVLVVPRPNMQSHESCGFLLKTGCIQSQSFRGNSYWFRGQPKIQPGTFWFNADERGSVTNVDSSQATVVITSGGASIRLIPSSGEWAVHRDK